jgi:hypothetical protein
MANAKVRPDARSVMKLKFDCLRLAQKLSPKAKTEDVLKLGRELYYWVRDDRPRARRKFRRALLSRDLDSSVESLAKMDGATFENALRRLRQMIALHEDRQKADKPS